MDACFALMFSMLFALLYLRCARDSACMAKFFSYVLISEEREEDRFEPPDLSLFVKLYGVTFEFPVLLGLSKNSGEAPDSWSDFLKIPNIPRFSSLICVTIPESWFEF